MASKFIQREVRFTGGFNVSILETLKWAYSPFLAKILFVICLGFIGRMCLLFTTNVIGYWVDSFCFVNSLSPEKCKPIPQFLNGYQSADFITLILILCLLGLALTLSYRVVFSRLSALAVSQIYDEVTYRTSRFPMSFFDSTPAGRIITRFSSDYGNVFRLFGGPLAEFIAIIFDLLAMIILITVASPLFLALVMAIGACNYFIFKLNQDKLRKERRELSFTRSPSISHFAETAQGASSIRIYLRENSFFQRFTKLNDLYQNQKLRTVGKITLFSFQMNSLTALLLLMTGLSSYFLVKGNFLSVGAVGVAFTFITFSGNTLQMFFEWLAQFEEAMIGVERLDQYIQHPIEAGARIPAVSIFPTSHWREDQGLVKNAHDTKASAVVKFEKINFKYRSDLPLVLKNISFEIKAGERVGIVGKTGSGKSTLVQCLFYMYPITEGHISIDGYSPALSLSELDSPLKMELVNYRSQVAFIAQEPTLFKGPLRANLTLDESISDQELTRVLERVGLHEWYQDLKTGLEYQIEERGRNLSQGERQLLCLARCLLQKSPVVVMDEATSNVDPQSEVIMVKATENIFKGKTQLIIAHRLSTIEKCDRILWLHNGEIKAFGPAQEVLEMFKSAELQEVLT